MWRQYSLLGLIVLMVASTGLISCGGVIGGGMDVSSASVLPARAAVLALDQQRVAVVAHQMLVWRMSAATQTLTDYLDTHYSIVCEQVCRINEKGN